MSFMSEEALEAPTRVRKLLSSDKELYQELCDRLRKLDPVVIGTVARGSSDHAASYAGYLFPVVCGKVVASIPPSLTSILKNPPKLGGQMVLAISQSGTSPDIHQSVDAFKAQGAITVALVNHVDSVVGRAADYCLDQHAGLERGLAATKTTVCAMAGIARIAAEWSRDSELLRGLQELPDLMSEAVTAGAQLSAEQLSGITNVLVVSRGLGAGAGFETSLKIKETCGLHAEAFSSAEVRHGPREIVNKNFAVIGLALPGPGMEDVIKATSELSQQGARVILVGPKEIQPTFALPKISDFRLAPILALQMLYPWLAKSSEKLGRDPDRPRVLTSKVVNTL